MSDASNKQSQGQLGSLIVSALFAIAGAITLYDTLSYTDRDSQVFPQTVAVILIVCSVVSFLMSLLKPENEGGFKQGSWFRRILLIATMFVCCIAMPIVGFLPAAAIAFVGGLLAAMHDRWSVKKITVYAASGIVIMGGFYVLFKLVLNVPLP